MKIKPVAATFLFGWFFASLFAMNKSIPFDLRYTLDWKYDAFGRPLVDLILQAAVEVAQLPLLLHRSRSFLE